MPFRRSKAQPGVFRQMFIQGNANEIEAKIDELKTGQSILDAITDQVRDLERTVGTADRERLDQYFTSVRELENRLQQSQGWERKPKPVVKEAEPQDPSNPGQYMAKVANMYRLVRLAFETDSTRSVTLMLDSVSTPVVEISGAVISDGYHNLSHHGKSEAEAGAAPDDRCVAHASACGSFQRPERSSGEWRNAFGPRHGSLRL